MAPSLEVPPLREGRGVGDDPVSRSGFLILVVVVAVDRDLRLRRHIDSFGGNIQIDPDRRRRRRRCFWKVWKLRGGAEVLGEVVVVQRGRVRKVPPRGEGRRGGAGPDEHTSSSDNPFGRHILTQILVV